MKSLKVKVLVATLTLAIVHESAVLADETPVSTESGISALTVTRFRVQGAAILMKGGSQSIEPSWNPSYRLSNTFSVGTNFGVAIHRAIQTRYFLLMDYRAMVTAEKLLWGLGLSAGFGAQTWVSNGGTHLTWSVDLPWTMDAPMFGLVRSVFVSYASLMTPTTGMLFRAGVELDL